MKKENNFLIEEEFNILKIGNGHNKKRVMKIMSNMIRNPGKSVLSQSATRTEAKAAYQFFNNPNIDINEMARIHQFRTIERIVETEKPILIIQDTTEANYTTKYSKSGLCDLGRNQKGIKLHNSIALTQDGLNLGVLSQIMISDDYISGKELSKHEKEMRSIDDKETKKWIDSFIDSTILIPHDIDVTVISDRESDIYEYFATVISHKFFFLTRIKQNRLAKCEEENIKVLDTIRKEKSQGEIIIAVPRNSANGIKARKAKLEVRFKQFEIKRPKNLIKVDGIPETLPVYVIHCEEIGTPAGSEPISWFLMTNKSIANLNEAVEQLKNYTQRWKIERFHFVLKTGGCNIEKIQARSLATTQTLIMLYSIISVFIMNLTYAARLYPDKLCNEFFDEDEWKLLYCMANKTGEAPETPYTIKEAVKYIAWIGGGKRAPSDGEPGMKLIWEGLEKFYLLYEYKEVIKLTVQV
jgi:hypothetical protein